jgi:hypothetical protein
MIGSRFISDPKMMVYDWAKAHLPQTAQLETTAFLPNWQVLFSDGLTISNIPMITGRTPYFSDQLNSNNKKVLNQILQYEGKDDIHWFTRNELFKRKPDYIVINSLHYEYFFRSVHMQANYPTILSYYQYLLNEETEYKIVFDETTAPSPWYIYPKNVDFLYNRVTVLKRSVQ